MSHRPAGAFAELRDGGELLQLTERDDLNECRSIPHMMATMFTSLPVQERGG